MVRSMRIRSALVPMTGQAGSVSHKFFVRRFGRRLGRGLECRSRSATSNAKLTVPMTRRTPFRNSVPKGRLNLAQDASPGLDLRTTQSRRACPELVERGRLKIGRDAILDNLQPPLRDSSCCMVYPGLTSWAKFSRPCGTKFISRVSHTRSTHQSHCCVARLKSCPSC